jgi:hypothetical protein
LAGVIDNDPQWIMERGCLDEMLKARKAGKVRLLALGGSSSLVAGVL